MLWSVNQRLQAIYKAMFLYLRCRKNTESKKPSVEKTKNGRIILASNCVVSHSKKSRFVKEQEATGLLSSLGIKTPLSQASILGPILFWGYKMKKIVNKFLLAGDKFMPEMQVRQPGSTCDHSACGPFTKNKERIKKLMKIEIYNIFIRTK